MAEYTLQNPLDLEERLQSTRLLGHDSGTHLAILRNMDVKDKKFDEEKYNATLAHIWRTQQTVALLTQQEELQLWDDVSSTYFSPAIVSNFLRGVDKILIEGRISGKNESKSAFLSEACLLHSVLYNLIKNGFNAQAGTEHRGHPIEVSVSDYGNFPENALFVPQLADNYNRFLKITIGNQGKGFPDNVPLKDYFNRPAPSIGKRGFGLYFARLAAKVLRAPIEIESHQGGAKVSFYQPIYVDCRLK